MKYAIGGNLKANLMNYEGTTEAQTKIDLHYVKTLKQSNKVSKQKALITWLLYNDV